MNKNLHRIIFNAARGQRMVVAETATSLGKGRNAAAHAVVTALAFASVFLLTPASAQIKADPSAPANQRPVILAAPNGVPVINIQTPSAAGISRNTYSQMDVARPGAILNNSRTNVQSQLGGFIQGNPYLATGSAKAILNEVNSANPTLLKGPVEVAGQRADVIIANPAGIKVDGSTFINAANVVLTTGTPQLSSQGSLESYRVQRGTIVIEGLGLDTRTASYTDILARAIEVNAGLWADYLRVSGGAAEVNATNPSAASAKPLEGMGAKPKFMLDVAAIGGMYARHIYLVGSESGLGVSNHGIIGAAEAGNVVVLADGTLTNRGSIQAAGHVNINAAGGISNSGTVYAGGNASLVTQGGIGSSGAIVAQGSATLNAATSITLNGQTTAAQAGITTGSLNTDGGALWAGQLTLTAQTLSNIGGEIVQTGAGDLALNLGGPLHNSQGRIAANGNASIVAQSLHNEGGTLHAAGASSLAITTSGELNNSSAGQIAAGGSVTLTAGSLRNTQGTIAAHNNLMLTAGALTNDAGKLLAKGTLDIHLSGDTSHTGEIAANGNVRIAATGQLTNSGKLQSGSTLTVAASDIHNTASGEIAGAATRLQATGSLTNRGLIDGQDTRIDAASVVNIGTGRIYGDRLGIAAGTLTNDAETIGGTSASITTAATIAARERLDIGVGSLINREHALIFSGGDMVLGGALDTQGKATGSASSIVNSSAAIEALGSLTITSHSLLNNNAHYSATEQAGGTRRVIQHAETGGARLAAADVRLCDANGCLAADNLSWLGTSEYRKLLLPSAEFPFAPLAAYYSSIPGYSRPVEDTTCQPDSLGLNCSTAPAGQWYGAADPIWTAFGVAPYTVPRPPMAADNNCALLGEHCFVGVAGYSPGIDQYVSFERAISQADVDEWSRVRAWMVPHEAAHAALDARLTQFRVSIQARLRQDWDWWDYSETSTTQVLASSDPGSIRSGGAMTLAIGGTATNRMSRIIAGGTLSLTGVAVANESADGASRSVQAGEAVHTYKKTRCGDFCNGDDRTYDRALYNAEVPGSVPLALAVTQGSTGQAPGTAAPGAVVLPTVSHAITQVPAAGQVFVRTVPPGWGAGASSLFRVAPNPQAGYFIETDPRFTSYSTWLTSDYLLDALGIKPGETAKRLGDGFIEQQMIREQVASLTGQRFLGDFTNDDAQYRALMESGVTFAKEWSLRPGIALTATQMAQLTSDIVWLVEQDVTLPDGRTVKALVPQVYARVRDGDLSPGGALLAGHDVKIDLAGDMVNSGTVLGRSVVSLTAQNLQNLGGRIAGDTVTVKAVQDLNVIGGQITAASSLIAQAGRDLNVQSTVRTTETANGNSAASRTAIDRVAGLYVTGNPASQTGPLIATSGNPGQLIATAGRDANIIAGVIANSAREGQTKVQAERDLNLGTVRTQSSDAVTWNAKNARSETTATQVGSLIQGVGSVSLQAGRDITAKAAVVNAGGAVTATAARDVTIEAGASSQAVDESHQYTSRGFLSKKVTTTHDQVSTTGAIGSSLGGETVTINAGRDIRVTGSAVVSDAGTKMTAARDVTVEAATETRTESHQSAEKISGLFGSGTGFTIGTREQSTDTASTSTSAAASTIGAVTGDVVIRAGGLYTQTGSDIVAPGGDVDIRARDVKITEARETSTTSTEQRFRQSGISVGISSPLITAAQTVGQMASAAGHTDDARMKALAIAAGALALKNNAADISKAAKALAEGDLKGAGSLSVSIGSSKSQSNTTSTSDTARESTVKAGGNVTIRATGAGTGEGETSNVLIRGSTVQAGNTLTLVADNQVLLQAARNEATRKSSEKSSSASIGVSIGASGFGITASGSTSRGHADGQDVYFSNTQVQGNTVVLKSGGDTDISGAVVRGNTVKADIGGNLTIQSKQDTSTYKEQSNSAGGSLTIGAGLGGSVSAGRTEIDSTYASVKEQSGIRAGDGGFQVEVKGRTNLIGGAITSTSQAVEEGRNQFESKEGVSLSDVHNTASYEASSGGFTIGVGGNLKNSGAGAGSKSASASSTTEAAISGIAGNQEARTGGAQTGITPIFNRDAVERDVKAQATIFTEFGRQAIPAAAGFADKKALELRREGKEEEAARWDEGGANRTAIYGALGFLSGGISGAAGAVAGAALVPTLGEEIAALNLPEAVRQGVTQLMGMAVGAAAGGAAGAATALPQTAFNYVSHSPFANVRKAVSQENARLLNACGANCTLADMRRMDLQLQKLEAAANLAAVAERSTMTAQQAAQFQQLALELVPFYGNAESVRQLVTGRTTVTDEEASRFWAAVGIAPLAGGVIRKIGEPIADVLSAAIRGGEAVKPMGEAGLVARSAAEGARLQAELAELARIKPDTSRDGRRGRLDGVAGQA